MVSCMILKGQCVVEIPDNEILISGIITWQVLGRYLAGTWQVLGRQNEGTTHISKGEITQKPAIPVHCRNLGMHGTFAPSQ